MFANRTLESHALMRRSDLPLLGFVLGIGISGFLWALLGAGFWLLLTQP